jgi:cobalt-zinc-cadmium efflux system outer membrane protein
MYKFFLQVGLPLSVAVLGVCPVMSSAAVTSDPAGAVTAPASPPTLTLEQAWQLGDAAGVAIRQARSRRSAAEGEADGASALLRNNPTISGERIRREVPEAPGRIDSRREWNVNIAQTFELAGQQGHRRRAARQDLDAIDAGIEEAHRSVRAEVEQRFVQVLTLQERIATESASLGIIEATALSVDNRVKAGEDSRLDGNLAKVEAVRARNQIGVLQEQLMQARAELGTVLQLPAGQLPTVTGELRVPLADVTLAQLQQSAAARPLLRAFEGKELAARSRLALERSARYPDLTVGISTGREGSYGARERLTGVSLSVPLPLFNRNAGPIGRAASELTLAQLDRQVAQRDTGADVAALWQQRESLNARVAALESSILPTLQENQTLSSKARQAGEISLVQLLLVNRQLLEGWRDLIEALAELRLTQIALEQAAGWLRPSTGR